MSNNITINDNDLKVITIIGIAIIVVCLALIAQPYFNHPAEITHPGTTYGTPVQSVDTGPVNIPDAPRHSNNAVAPVVITPTPTAQVAKGDEGTCTVVVHVNGGKTFTTVFMTNLKDGSLQAVDSISPNDTVTFRNVEVGDYEVSVGSMGHNAFWYPCERADYTYHISIDAPTK